MCVGGGGGGEVHTYRPANSIFESPVTNLLSVLCILIETLSRAYVCVCVCGGGP